MDLPHWPGWHLLGAYPDHEPDDVGSWILHHEGDAALLEVPPGLSVGDVRVALEQLGRPRLGYVTASHKHCDHLDGLAWGNLARAFPDAAMLHPSRAIGSSTWAANPSGLSRLPSTRARTW